MKKQKQNKDKTKTKKTSEILFECLFHRKLYLSIIKSYFRIIVFIFQNYLKTK